MKLKILNILLVFAFVCGAFVFAPPNTTKAQAEPVNLYLFYGLGCPHCAKERTFLDELELEYADKIAVYEYEIYYDEENSDKFVDVIEYLDIDVGGVPFLVIGEKYFVGYGSDSTTGKEIEDEVKRCLSDGCVDNLRSILIDEEPIEENEEVKIENASEGEDASPIYLDTRIFGKVDLKSISLPVATVLIALVDGFNPCAMWILIFLISMLINMRNKKRLYALGSIFIITSGIVYFFFLAAWFNFFKFVGYVYWIKVIIGLVAIVSGYLHIKDGLKADGTCKVTNKKQRASIMQRVKKTLTEKNFALSVIGIVTLAISVNLIEVVCSAGLPAIYTNLLSSINLTTLEYYVYLLLYVLIFMLDDLIIFFIAVKTFEIAGITKKYTKWSSLVGGVIIFLIGIILILKPELLMLG